MGGGDMIRAGRMLATGDLRLIALALIAEQPRHGYEIIKVLEDKTAGWYSPSPGVVYPTLTFLEEAGYVTAQTEGAKKLYTITEEGRAHLEENRDFVDAVLERMTSLGEKATSCAGAGAPRRRGRASAHAAAGARRVRQSARGCKAADRGRRGRGDQDRRGAGPRRAGDPQELERFPLNLTHTLRHARPCAGHPRLCRSEKDVDGRASGRSRPSSTGYARP